jgi:hypothetical protein
MSELEAYPTTLAQFEAVVRRLAAQIGAPEHTLPTFTTCRGDATPHIEVRGDGFHFVVSERGEEYERVVSRDAKEILYLVFEPIAFSMASSYEVEHRVPGVDSRRLLFKRQLELLGQLDSSWQRRCKKKQRDVLRRHPYRDD